MTNSTCSVDGCANPVKARGWCAGHYQRWQKGKPVDGPISRGKPKGVACELGGCALPAKTAGMCSAHYTRLLRGKDLGAPLRSKTKLPCSVDGCSNLTKWRGYCLSHYQRWKKHGDPLGGGPYIKTARGEAKEFARRAILHDGDECLLWPYNQNSTGYGRLYLGGRMVLAHRYVLTLAVSPPPFEGAVAAHAPVVCHSRLCVNPRHLRWATQTENMADRWLDGTVPLVRRSGSVAA